MSLDLSSRRHAGDAAHDHHAQMSHAHPGRGSAASQLEAAKPAMFAGGAEWENIEGEDPAALDEAHQPSSDEEPAAPADDEGELDAESEHDEEEEMAEPPAPEAHASAPGQAPAHAATPAAQAPQGHGSPSAGHGNREGVKARASGAGKTYHVNRAYRDGPYGGTAKYDVRVTAKDVTISVGIRLTPGRGVSKKQLVHVKEVSQAIFKQKYDKRFRLTEVPYRPRPLRMQLRFAHNNPHHKVALHKGGGRDNASNWFAKGDATTRAHEIGHLLGLLDEYADAASPKRKVYTDNSLMGNYYTEGIKTAKLKKRHGKTFAKDISRASGRKFHLSA